MNSQPVSQVRTQVYFPRSLYRAVKERAQKEDVSIAEIIRKAVRQTVQVNETTKEEKEKAWKGFLKMAGFIKGGPRDLARNHDKYFDAFAVGKRSHKQT